MADIDLAQDEYIEEAKRFLELASDWRKDGCEGARAALHAAILIGVCALEAAVNAISRDFIDADKQLCIAERSILEEKEIRLAKDGKLELRGRKMSKLPERILLLYAKYAGKPYDTQHYSWSQLTQAIELRNKLVHTKSHVDIKHEDVARALRAIIFTIDQLYRGIHRKPYPIFERDLGSKMGFGSPPSEIARPEK